MTKQSTQTAASSLLGMSSVSQATPSVTLAQSLNITESMSEPYTTTHVCTRSTMGIAGKQMNNQENS